MVKFENIKDKILYCLIAILVILIIISFFITIKSGFDFNQLIQNLIISITALFSSLAIYHRINDERIKNRKELKKIKQIQNDCIKSLRRICQFLFDVKGYVIETFPEEPDIYPNLSKLESNKEIIEKIGIIFKKEHKKITITRAFMNVDGLGIYIYVDCLNELEIKLDIYEFSIERIVSLKINGKEAKKVSDIEDILNCLEKKVKKSTYKA